MSEIPLLILHQVTRHLHHPGEGVIHHPKGDGMVFPHHLPPRVAKGAGGEGMVRHHVICCEVLASRYHGYHGGL